MTDAEQIAELTASRDELAGKLAEANRLVEFWQKSSEEWKASRDRILQRAEQAEAEVKRVCELHQGLMKEADRKVDEAGAAVPEGYRLVLKQWTTEMAHAGFKRALESDIQWTAAGCAECGLIYDAMLSASPAPAPEPRE